MPLGGMMRQWKSRGPNAGWSWIVEISVVVLQMLSYEAANLDR
jgi:hypothetical protein